MRRFCPPSSFVLLALLVFVRGPAALAQGVPEPRGPQFLLASASPTKAPVVVDAGSVASLRRRVSLSLDGARVGEALAELSRVSGLQIVYADGVVPSEARVHLRAEEITVAAALTEVLLDAGVDVLISPGGSVVLVKRGVVQTGNVAGRVTDGKTGQPIVGASVALAGTRWRATTGNDGRYRLEDVTTGTYTLTASRIGYAKRSQSVTVAVGQEVTVDVALQAAPTELQQVVVTGTIIPTERKAIPTPISVITGEQLEQKGYQRVDQIFRGDIPGVIAWDRSASNYFSNIAIRGASSLSLNAVKTYIDGVEVADPIYIATIDPASIARIEVLRGPQGSTLYGAQALAGVMQIFTKQGTATPHPEVEAKVSGGVIQSPWSNAGQQDHALAVSGGDTSFSYRLGGGFLQSGDWVPHVGSGDPSLYGSMQGTQGPLGAAVSARYARKAFGINNNPDFAALFPTVVKLIDESFVVTQQTYGLTLRYAATLRWQHTLVLGYDRTGLDYHFNTPVYRTPADSFLSVGSSDETKRSVAYHTTLEAPLGGAVQAALTAGLDHWTYQLGSYSASNLPRTTDLNNLSASSFTSVTGQQYSNTGGFAQGQLSVREAVFVTAGLRADDSPNFGRDFGLAWAPRLGVAYVHAFGDLTAKARVAYGQAIRPPQPLYATAFVSATSVRLANPNLGPEKQVGPDGGLELYFGRRGSLEVSYYHQTVQDLIGSVVLSPAPVYTFQFQNVGRIRNTGWEFQGRLSAGRLALTGTASIVHSEVERLSPSYTGDLRPGDQMLAIPWHTAGATLSYGLPRTVVALGLTYIGAWTNYNIRALYTDYYVKGIFTNPLRTYWATYPGFAKLNLSVSQGVTDRVRVFLQADNLTNNTVHEVYDLNMNTGRVTMVGVRVKP